MTFPLGSLRSDGGAPNSFVPAAAGATRGGPRSASPLHAPAGWRAQLGLLITGVLWLLAVLALATHNAGDAAFSTSGTAGSVANKAGSVGAWFSDLAYFGFGYSIWWAVVVALRAWLGGLAHALRSDPAALAPAPATPPVWLFWVGLALLLGASSA